MTKQQLSQLDGRMATSDNAKTAIIYSMRNWQAFHMPPVNSHAQDNHQYLEKAYLGAMAAHRQNEPSAWLYSLAIFMAIESRHLDTATSMLEAAASYRSFLKTNEPFYYNAFRFLEAYLAIIESRSRAAKKYRKAFLSQLKSSEYSPHYDVMIGQLHQAAKEYTEAYSYFARAYSYGCHSIYMYEGLFRTLTAADPNKIGEELIPTLLNAAKNGADISRQTTAHEEAIFAQVTKNPAAGERLYALTSHAPLLKPICANKMYNNDLSLSAHKLYSQAVKQQINLKGLLTFLVQSAYLNHIEKIDSYPLERFLTSTNIEPHLAAYVFHLILTDPTHRKLMQGRERLAHETAIMCLKSGITGREANSLYQFFHASSKSSDGEAIQGAEAELLANLTLFEITATKDTRHIYIALNEKRGTYEYTIPENEENRIIIEAPHENFQYSCLGAGRRMVITTPITIKRMAPLANPELYQYFFNKGDRRFNILAYLSTHYIETETQNPEAIAVFEAILDDKSLQKPYRMKILAALGHLYHITQNSIKSQECYAQLDMHTLPPANLQQALSVCLQTKEYALATEIIAQNHKTLPAKTVYEGLIQLLKDHKAPANTGKHLAEAAYSLLLSGHQSQSEILLTTVLTHYQASQSELKALSQEITDSRLDVKILSGNLWANQCDIHTQKAFRRLITEQKAQRECEQFIEYCAYAMLTQNLVPEYEIINILEKHYLAISTEHNYSNQEGHKNTCIFSASNPLTPSGLLLLALCNTYLRNNITTFRSDKLLKLSLKIQEAAGILLPIFKETKPIAHPYVEKYQSFLFQSQPGKDIRLNYRFCETNDFHSIPMRYLAYGIYTAKLPLFYNETITYYYSDEMSSGSITTHKATHKNTTPYLHHIDAMNEAHKRSSISTQDNFYAINNAIIHEHMFRHQEMEDLMEELIQNPIPVQAQIL